MDPRGKATCHSSLLLHLRERFGYCGHPNVATVNTHTVREGGRDRSVGEGVAGWVEAWVGDH